MKRRDFLKLLGAGAAVSVSGISIALPENSYTASDVVAGQSKSVDAFASVFDETFDRLTSDYLNQFASEVRRQAAMKSPLVRQMVREKCQSAA